MRVRVTQTPNIPEVDGVRLDVFRPGLQSELGNTLAALFLVEGWAEPVASDEPAMVSPISVSAAASPNPPNLVRETLPLNQRHSLAVDRRRRPRQ
jgi:hypothetical protein